MTKENHFTLPPSWTVLHINCVRTLVESLYGPCLTRELYTFKTRYRLSYLGFHSVRSNNILSDPSLNTAEAHQPDDKGTSSQKFDPRHLGYPKTPQKELKVETLPGNFVKTTRHKNDLRPSPIRHSPHSEIFKTLKWST